MRTADMYQRDRLSWYAHHLSAGGHEDGAFLRDQLEIINDRANRELETSYVCIRELFQIWLLRPGDLSEREQSAMQQILHFINRGRPQITIQLESKCAEASAPGEKKDV
jgi:hypothetical protein